MRDLLFLNKHLFLNFYFPTQRDILLGVPSYRQSHWSCTQLKLVVIFNIPYSFKSHTFYSHSHLTTMIKTHHNNFNSPISILSPTGDLCSD